MDRFDVFQIKTDSLYFYLLFCYLIYVSNTDSVDTGFSSRLFPCNPTYFLPFPPFLRYSKRELIGTQRMDSVSQCEYPKPAAFINFTGQNLP